MLKLLLSLEFYLSGLAIEQGAELSNQPAPPFDCTDCAPAFGYRDEPVIAFARFLEYEGYEHLNVMQPRSALLPVLVRWTKDRFELREPARDDCVAGALPG